MRLDALQGSIVTLQKPLSIPLTLLQDERGATRAAGTKACLDEAFAHIPRWEETVALEDPEATRQLLSDMLEKALLTAARRVSQGTDEQLRPVDRPYLGRWRPARLATRRRTATATVCDQLPGSAAASEEPARASEEGSAVGSHARRWLKQSRRVAEVVRLHERDPEDAAHLWATCSRFLGDQKDFTLEEAYARKEQADTEFRAIAGAERKGRLSRWKDKMRTSWEGNWRTAFQWLGEPRASPPAALRDVQGQWTADPDEMDAILRGS